MANLFQLIYKYRSIIFIVLSVSCILFIGNKYNNLKKDFDVVNNNLESSLSESKYYQTKYGNHVLQTNGLRMELSDLKRLNSRLIKEIDSLGISLKNASSVVKTKIVVEYKNDTIIKPVLRDSLSYYSVKDKYIDLSFAIDSIGNIPKNKLNLSIPVSLYTVQRVQYKGIWFWKKAKGVEVLISTDNKYVNIMSGEYIQLKF